MSGRSSSTFKKRQKELARQHKQREKAEKRMQRKLEKQNRGPGDLDDAIDFDASVDDFVPVDDYSREDHG
jgi:hypothetical protein